MPATSVLSASAILRASAAVPSAELPTPATAMARMVGPSLFHEAERAFVMTDLSIGIAGRHDDDAQYVEDPEGDESALFERLRITTLGAVVGLPPAFKKVKQYLGALDWFGRANSSLGVMHERVPEAGHHLNSRFPYHMSVAALLNAEPLSGCCRNLPWLTSLRPCPSRRWRRLGSLWLRSRRRKRCGVL
jgi:hypothetical protein